MLLDQIFLYKTKNHNKGSVKILKTELMSLEIPNEHKVFPIFLEWID